MNKNYYQILQIDVNASPEIVEKAYKTLVKKYHPDLQDETQKKVFQEILKEINEAYETLSNTQKRKEYNTYLNNTFVSRQAFDKLYAENQILKEKLSKLEAFYKNNQNSYYSVKTNIYPNYKYNIKKDHPKSLYDYLKFLFAFSVTILFFLLMIKLTFLKK